MIKKLIVFLLIFSSIEPKVLILDLGGEFVNPNKLGVASEIGLKYFLAYTLLDWKNPNIQKRLFDVLRTMETPQEKKIKRATAPDDTKLPAIMCYWQAGTLTGPEIIKLVNKQIEKLAKEDYFVSDREKILIKRTIRAMFDPEILARNVDPVPQGVKLLEKLAEERNPDGSRKHTLIAFSNWDALSFRIFERRYPDIFSYFDHVVISGEIGLIKPHRRAFQYLLDTYKLNPADCLLLDDQKVNEKAAKECGIKTLLVRHYDFAKLNKQLYKMGILTEKD